MKKNNSFTNASVLILILLFGWQTLPAQTQWQPVSREELALKTPKVEPDADAEALFWQVRIVDSYDRKNGWQSVLDHHLRIKIFTERGREKNSKVDIPFGNLYEADSKVSIKDIAARTIKPDGTVIELGAEEIFERDIVKGSGLKLKAKSFAVPGIETGAVLEYRWTEVREDAFNYTRLMLARDMPVHFVRYYVKPAVAPVGMRLHSFNTSGTFVKEPDGFYSTVMQNVPAFKEEPRMPSEYDIKPWVLFYYGNDDEKAAADYWKERGINNYTLHKTWLKPGGEIKKAAAQAVGDAVDPQEKIRRIFNFCRRSLRDFNDDASGISNEERKSVKENKTPADTLKRGIGNWHDIDMVFAAMLIAAGFDARVANVATRADARFDKKMPNSYFIRTEIIAVKVGSDWQFYDLSNRNLPFGMVVSTIEGQDVLISDASEPFWKKVPVADAAQTREKRTARLRLASDGSLEGDVRIEYTGHLADFYREYNDDDSIAEREKFLTEMIRRQVGNEAELTSILIENLADTEKPFVYAFRIKVPAYAERTGKRIFLRPNIFKRNSGALFTANKRQYDVVFNFPWSESDEIAIEIPPGYTAESLDSPKPVKDEKTGGTLETKLAVSEDGKMLDYRRSFSFGTPDSLVVYEFKYAGIKGLFDAFHNADSHSLILREGSRTTN